MSTMKVVSELYLPDSGTHIEIEFFQDKDDEYTLPFCVRFDNVQHCDFSEKDLSIFIKEIQRLRKLHKSGQVVL